MKRAIGSVNPKLSGFDASCFDGIYVAGNVCAEDIERMNSVRTGEESEDDETSRLALPNSGD